MNTTATTTTAAAARAVDPVGLVPVMSARSDKVHATRAPDPVSAARVATLCGRTLRANASWTAGTFALHAASARPGYVGGGCVRCSDAAGLARP